MSRVGSSGAEAEAGADAGCDAPARSVGNGNGDGNGNGNGNEHIVGGRREPGTRNPEPALGGWVGGYNPPMSSSALVHFVRDVLGCGCPDEVLQSITVGRGRWVPVIDGEITRLDVGGRLLVYVVEPAGAEPLTTVVSGAIAAGLADRERHGFNRFRLVLATSDPATIEEAARAAFEVLKLLDDRVHLHVVAAEDCQWSSGDS